MKTGQNRRAPSGSWLWAAMHSSLWGLTAVLLPPVQLAAYAQDSICARVKIEIKQELTLERQAFDAEMQINNGLTTQSLENVAINVSFADETGNAVRATSDPNDATALFFIRIDSLKNINSINGGQVAPATTAQINWLIIPSPGAGGSIPIGKLYLVGASLTYTLAGEPQSVTVSPDSIYVKPTPKLTLDYFLERDVFADDPFTNPIEPPVPFTLGVRVKNSGFAPARNLKIESAQPRIVENKQGLLINFLITGSFLNDLPATNSLLIDFGEIPSQKANTGRWLMETTLSGRFVEFSADFTHADELGGTVTSLIDRVSTHSLVKDVKVDVPGRDNVRDFLARDGDVLRVYESDSDDTNVTEQSKVASLTGGAAGGAEVALALNAPPTAGFFYVKLPDPYSGAKVVGAVVRSDGKRMAPENVWLSKSRVGSGPWQYFINFFDANSTGRYNLAMKDPVTGPLPPLLQFIADRTVKEGEQASFIVEASDPNLDPVKLSAAPLPSGATFTDGGAGVGIFDWTAQLGQAGKYTIVYTASDGALQSSRTARITVLPARSTGPDIPALIAPLLEADARVLRPILLVQSPNPVDTVQRYFFELYADESLHTLVAQSDVAKGVDSTTWKVPQDLTDNTRYWWRVRAFDGTLYSEWANGRFTVNLFNDPPRPPVPSSPNHGAEVDSLTPMLVVTNTSDPDGDPVKYGFEVFGDAKGALPVASVQNLQPGIGGVTAWTVSAPLQANHEYWWRASAADPSGALTESALQRFLVDPRNLTPSIPAVQEPANATVVTGPNSALTIVNAIDPEGDTLAYFFELDRSPTFNSTAKRLSPPVPAGNGMTTWSVTGLADNTLYYWRVRADDGRHAGPWANAQFRVSASDDAPPVPVLRNLGPGAWTDSARPRLELAPVADLEGQAVTYHFQVYADAALQDLVGEQQGAQPEWLLPAALADSTVYFWRARTLDDAGNSSGWSDAAAFAVNVAGPRPLGFAFATPARITTPVGATQTIAWEMRDPENDSTLALYFDTDGSGVDGTLIAENLEQDPARRAGRYDWNISALSPAAYYVYAIATNGQRTAVQYAPGPVVIPSPAPKGSVMIKATSAQTTTELGLTASQQVVLGSAPASEVTIGFNSTRPGEAAVTPASVLFTPANWNVPQTISVKGLNDCAVDGDQAYRVIAASALSADINYAGAKGAALPYVNADDDTTTGAGALATCNFRIVASRRVGLLEFDYDMVLDLTNLGPAVAGVTGTVTSSAAATKIVEGAIVFGPIPSGGTATSVDAFTIRQDRRVPFDPGALRWTLQPIP